MSEINDMDDLRGMLPDEIVAVVQRLKDDNQRLRAAIQDAKLLASGGICVTGEIGDDDEDAYWRRISDVLERALAGEPATAADARDSAALAEQVECLTDGTLDLMGRNSALATENQRLRAAMKIGERAFSLLRKLARPRGMSGQTIPGSPLEAEVGEMYEDWRDALLAGEPRASADGEISRE